MVNVYRSPDRREMGTRIAPAGERPDLPLVAWYAASSGVDVADLSVVPVSE
jgi:hypothetical protein